MSWHWVKDIPDGSILFDEENRVVVMKEYIWGLLGRYDGTLPTSPSPGRIYRRRGYVMVCRQAPDDPKMIDHVPYEPLFVE